MLRNRDKNWCYLTSVIQTQATT